jgi:hypothetical protein
MMHGQQNIKRNPQSQSAQGQARHWNPETFACEVVRRIISARPEM